MNAWVWKVPGGRSSPTAVTVVGCAADVESARQRLNGALNDLPECLNAAAIARWINGQPPTALSATDDLGLAISADIYV
jgi:hypothetical protein